MKLDRLTMRIHASPEIQIIVRVLLCFAALAAFAATVGAQQPAVTPDENVDWPSPDGKLAFRVSDGEDGRALELIERSSGKKLWTSDDDSDHASWHVLWAPGSKRFALMTRVGHPIQGVDVYFRSGETFQKIDLPTLPDADIPEKLKHGKKFPHFAALNWQEAKEWKTDGSLVVMIVTTVDGGDGGSITATRTVVLSFGPAKAKIMKSTIKYEMEKD
jgi:hypothetical protein